MAECSMWFRCICSSSIETLANSVVWMGFQSRYAKSFERIVAVNSVAPVQRLTHLRFG